MKIVMIGQNDPAGMMIAFAKALNRLTEHTVRVISMRTVYAMDYEFDIELPRIKDEDFSEVQELLKSADVFHFHMLLDEDYQLGPLEIRDYVKGKGLIHHHHGTYDHQCFLAKAQDYNEKYKRLNRKAIVSTPDLLKLLPIASWQPNLVPINSEDFLPSFGQQKELPVKIVQAPTRKWHKHTAELKRVCEKLKEQGLDIECHILEGKTYRECLQFKRNCHISFDHMNGWFGIASLESLCHGVPTLAGLDDWNIEKISEFAGRDSLPWVVVRTEEELELSLTKLSQDAEERLLIGRHSREFMEQCWTQEQVLEPLLKTYESL